MPTVLEIVKKTTEFFSGRGIESARLNAEIIIGHALALPRMQLYLRFEQNLSEADLEKIRPLVRRRGQREPLQYITGETEFAGLKLKTDRRALIPRPETEYLVEIVGEILAQNPPSRGLDLGTGTGALANAFATKFPSSTWMAADLSEEALALARENSLALGLAERVTCVKSDWFSAIPTGEKFDLMVANPPYLSSTEWAETAPEVKEFEPRAALTPEDSDGSSALQVILQHGGAFLATGGLLALEIGIAHGNLLREHAARHGWTSTETRNDLTGRERYFFARREAHPAGADFSNS